jgi:hypothetical protein
MRLAAALVVAFCVPVGTASGQDPTPTPTPTPTATPTPTPTPTPEPTKAEKKVLRDYRRDGVIEACDHKKKVLKQVLEDLPPEADIDTPDLRPALEAAIEQHKAGDCKEAAEPTPTPTPSPTATATPAPTVAPTSTPDNSTTPLPPVVGGGGNSKPPSARDVKPLEPAVTPVPPAATPVPEATVAPEPTGPVATPEPVYSNADDAIPPSLLVLAALLVLLALLAALLGLAGRFGWYEERLAGWRRSLREASFRMGGTWGDFADWMRLGR